MHLVVTLSNHGYGHAVQAAAVVNVLRRMRPGLRLTLRATLPRAFLARRFEGDFTLLSERTDIGMIMRSAIDVLPAESARAYRAFHQDWDRRIAAEAERLQALAPDLVLSNVAYLPLAASARIGVPAAALCSLNWADMYRHYCGDAPEAARIHAEIVAAYRSASLFLQPAPHMPMADLTNRYPIGPVATLATRRIGLPALLRLPAGTRLVLVSPGGMSLPLAVARWPRVPDIHWIVPEESACDRPDVTAFERLNLAFPEVLAASDALVTKPGYGSFVEAGCSGVPVLYVRRFDWPEEPYLIDWLTRHTRAREIPRADMEQGALANHLAALWDQPVLAPALPTGASEAAQLLAQRLSTRAAAVL